MQEVKIFEKVSLREHNSWKVGGFADFFVQPENIEEVKSAYLWALNHRMPMTFLGSGSNVLISDLGVRGLTISTKKFSGLLQSECDDLEFKVSCWSGTAKSNLMKEFLKHKLAPALFLTGLPGDIAGGVVMNAGVGDSYAPREFCEITDWIEVLRPQDLTGFDFATQTYEQSPRPMAASDLEVVRYSSSQIKWHYRSSEGWQPGFITRVGFRWPNKPDSEIMNKMKLATRKRISTQPLTQPSCGSTFRNPEGAKSGQLIEACGLKGFQVGGAQVSTKHANFIVTNEEASAQDVLDIIRHIQSVVKAQTGHELHTEVKLLGDFSS